MPLTRRETLERLWLAGTALALPSAAKAAELEIGEAVRALLFIDESAAHSALSALSAYEARDIVPSLIFGLRYAHVHESAFKTTLARITGDGSPKDWFDWMVWQERHPEIVPHPSYVTLKREVFLLIDRNFGVFLRPEYLQRDRMTIRFEEVTWGGVAKDGIPSLDNPELLPAKDAEYLLDDDLVFGVSINGDVRAYPLRIMGWHEMFNEVIGGVPVALAYCTLCGAGILFETQVEGREEAFVFGSSGFLYRSNKLMFDRETHSLWNQFTGQPVSGPLVEADIALKQRPVAIARWSDWRVQNPETRVLSLNTGHRRDYGSGAVYRDYFASPDLMFPVNVDESALLQKDYIFGVRTFGGAKAWPLKAFDGGRVINDRVADLNLVLVGDVAGRTVRAYDRDGREFEPGGVPNTLVSDGGVWTVTEEAIVGPTGEKAPRVAGHIAYWFAWNNYLGIDAELFDG